jgi:peptide/nickel transport system permease protein
MPLQGEFGLSYRLSRPVAELIAERAPATLELALCAAFISLCIGVPMGIYTGLFRHSWLSRFLLTFSLIGVSLPTFLIGILLILVFSVWLGWLPSFGRGDVVQIGWWSTGLLTLSGLKALILPAITLALPDHADHAPGPGRDAGGAAHRLHPLRPGPRPAQRVPSISAMR